MKIENAHTYHSRPLTCVENMKRIGIFKKLLTIEKLCKKIRNFPFSKEMNNLVFTIFAKAIVKITKYIIQTYKYQNNFLNFYLIIYNRITKICLFFLQTNTYVITLF